MSGNKYNSSVSVNWRNVMKLYKIRINSIKFDAMRFYDYYKAHLIHNYPDFLDCDRARVVEYVSDILSLVDELNTLRSFLRYKTCNYSEFLSEDILSFYNEQKDKVKPEHNRFPEGYNFII